MKEGLTLSLGPVQLATFLEAAIKAGEPVLVEGEPGIGKSEIITQVVEKLGFDLKLFHPAVSDPTDFKGVCWPNTTTRRADILPLTDLGELLDATKPTVAVFDDLIQTPHSVQAPIMQLIRARRIGSLRVPDCVRFLAATNGRTHKAGGTSIIEPLKSRFTSIVRLVVKLEDSILHWYKMDRSPLVAGFWRMRPDLISNFNPSSDLGQSPSPRTWEGVDKILRMKLPADVEGMAICGGVGEGAGGEFISHKKVADELFDLDLVIKDPMHAPIPTGLGALYAMVAGMAYRATGCKRMDDAEQGNFANILKYADRLRTGDKGKVAKQGVFGVLLVLDSARRNPEVCNTVAFDKLAHSEFGSLIRGGTE